MCLCPPPRTSRHQVHNTGSVCTHTHSSHTLHTTWQAPMNLWYGVEQCNIICGIPVVKHESLLHDIIEGRMMGKATWDRNWMQLLSDLMKGKYVAVKRTAEDRKDWQKLLRAGSHTPASQQIIEWMNSQTVSLSCGALHQSRCWRNESFYAFVTFNITDRQLCKTKHCFH